ncbi:MAG: Eco57I restriction-modification methylase domain-containing protein [Prevotella sp.]|nr:Eco57I restriction-modification methylase domain-containing protein [Prevotella sp.]
MPNKDLSSSCIDIKEDDLLALSAPVLDALLRDHTTGRNIFWATHDYEALGSEYDYHSQILPHLITGENGMVVRPRVLKSKEEQTDRVKDMAEVFTPSWVVKKMVDYVDIGVNTRCLELTCGEAPFLVSRYDATTGEPIATTKRVGILDKKLQIVNDLHLSDEEWLAQVRLAFQSTYGYEWQGDSLLLARENILYTFVDYYEARYGSTPDVTLLQEFAEIISWNLWQMDGLTYRIPQEHKEESQIQLTFFDKAPAKVPAPLCKIKDWQRGIIIKVNDIKRRQTKNQDNMKFDVIIGNPPYQEELEGTSDSAIYNFFMDEAYKNGQIVELITPARWLFNAGKTKKEWNNKMLSDKNLKVLVYEGDSSVFFSNTDIKGGIAITYHDNNRILGPIGVFSPYGELKTITEKLKTITKKENIISIIYLQNRFNLKNLYSDYPNVKTVVSSNGKERRIVSSAFEKITAFTTSEENVDDIKILGLIANKRLYKWIRKQYIEDNGNLDSYKVLIPKSNGKGELGEQLSTPIIAQPKTGYTQSFIGFGAFGHKNEAENMLKYIKTKFVRTALSILKITQDNPPERWKYVPLQDFTPSSDIDWSKSIAEIDEQLFDKYGLDEQERDFIRTKVKEMN